MHDRVRTDHDQLKQIMALFGQQADATARTLMALRRQKEVLQGGDWTGQGARKFYDEMDGSVLPALTRLQRALTQAQQTTQKISNRMRQAEADAAAVLKDREAFSGQANASGSAFAGASASASASVGSGGGGFWSQVGGFFKGVGLGAKDMVTGLWTAVTHPIDTIKGLGYAVTHPGELWDAIKKPYTEAWARGDYGEAIGRGAFEIASLFFPPGGGAAAKGGTKAAEVGADVARVANIASDVARAGEKAAQVGHVASTISDAGRAGARFAEAAGDVVKLHETWAVAEEAANIPKILDRSTELASIGRGSERSGQLVEDLAELNTHGAGDRLVLGKWEAHADELSAAEVTQKGGYIADAKANGGRWFETAPGQYDILKGQGLQMDVNLRVLEREMQAGTSRVEFVGFHVDDLLQEADDLMAGGRARDALNARYQEVLYLDENAGKFGYVRDGNGWTYAPPTTGGSSAAVRGAAGAGIVIGRDLPTGEGDTP